jgi:DNA-binding transcriptional MocR family regulator
MQLNVPQSTQMTLREGFIEFTWGQPDPALLPVEAMRRATESALKEYGADTLGYGAASGSGPLLAWARNRMAEREGVNVTFDEIIGTAGNSDAVDQICTLFTRPGDIALVESPTYHLALRIMHDHALDLQPVATDAGGLRPEALKRKLAQLKRDGQAAKLLYTIPTHHNPTGLSLAAERRRALVEIAAESNILVVEDDVYRELTYDGDAPPSLFSLAPRGAVLRLSSFAKSLAPGLRLGTLAGQADQLRRFSDGGLRDSGGGVNHYAAMMVGALCAAGDFDAQVLILKAEYRARRDALLDALAEFMPPGVSWTRPAGGFFVWVTLPEPLDAAPVLAAAEARAVTFIPGHKFCLDGGGRDALRLAFSLYPPHELAEGAKRLAQAVKDALH